MEIAERRNYTIGAVTLVVVIVLVIAFWPDTVAVDLAYVHKGDMAVTIDDEGRTRVREVYVVSAPTPGRLKRIEIHAGDHVVANETVLAEIEPNDPTFLDARGRAQAEAQVKAAAAGLNQAKAESTRAVEELKFSRSEFKRAQALFAKGNLSSSHLERAELEVRQREAALQTANAIVKVKESELETARAALIQPGDPASSEVENTDEACCVPVRAPVTGRVLKVLHENESVVDAGMPIVEIGDPADLEIVVELLSSDAVQVAEGSKVIIEGWGGARPLVGRIHRVEPYGFTKVSALGIEEQRVNVIVDIESPYEMWQALGHGFRVDARVVVWEATDIIIVPLSAIFRKDDGWATFVYENGRALERRVVVGHLNASQAEALEGLDELEAVVVHPSDRITDGLRIKERTGF